MHIAICDDNVADRKQMERLLQRESDKRISTTGNLYIDSYGNAQALLANPMQYDAFYIDMCKTEGITGFDVVANLTARGVYAPIILCCSDIDYRSQTCPENVIFLDKPIKTLELSASIDHALAIKKKAPSMIELRERENTIYVLEEENLYGIENGFYVMVTLTDGRLIEIATSALNFFCQVECHPVFLAPTERTVINCRYIAKFGFGKVFMTDGKCFKVPRDCMKYAKEMYAELSKQSQ